MELKSFFAQDRNGKVIPHAKVHVYKPGTKSLVSNLRDKNNNNLANPFISNGDGLVQFYAANGAYDMHVVSGARENNIRIQFLDINDAGMLPVSSATGLQTLNKALNDRTIYIDSIDKLQEIDTNKLMTGQQFSIKSYQAGTGVGGGDFYWDAESTEIEDRGIIFGKNAKGRFKRRYSGAIYSDWFNLKNDTTEDQTEKFFSAKNAAEKKGAPLYLANISFVISKTCIIRTRSTSRIEGTSAPEGTTIIFRNDPGNGGELGKTAILYAATSSGSVIQNIQLKDEIAGSSVGISIIATLSSGSPNWKNAYERVELRDFLIGATTTTENPLAGKTHAWASETLFFNCKFRNCRTSFLNRNLQAVNTTLIDTDMENDDNGEEYTLIRDEAGGEIKVIGGSFIGRGIFYSWIFPKSAKNLWYSGKITFYASRWEVRDTGKERSIFKEDYETRANFSRSLTLVVDNVQINAGHRTVDLLHYAGKINAIFNKVEFSLGSGIIRQHPTTNLSGLLTLGSMSSVTCNNSTGIHYERATSTPYEGNYDEDLTGSVNISTPANSTGRTYNLDSDDFLVAENNEFTEFGLELSVGLSEKSLVYGKNKVTTGFNNIKLVLPKYSRPIKLWTYKQPIQLDINSSFRLYAVKDKKYWKSNLFNKNSDAVLISDIGDTTGQAGYFESNVILTENIFGLRFQSGLDNWLEGRLYIELVGEAVSYAGWVGIKFY